MKSFSISEALQYGWTKMKEEFSFVFLVTVIMWGLMLLSEGLYRFIDVTVATSVLHDVILILLVVVTIVLSIVLQAGFLKIFLKLHDDEDTELPELYTNYRIFWKLALGSLLQFIIVLIGFLLLIIPGIIFALRYAFTKLIIVDKGINPIAALRQSAQITKGAKFQLFKLAIVLWLINIVGILLLIGFFITLPVTMFTMVYVYRKLASQTSNL